MAPPPELSVFVNMAPAPDLCFFQHGCGSGCVLLIHINNFGIPSVLLVASERVIPTYFELYCSHYQAWVLGRSLV